MHSTLILSLVRDNLSDTVATRLRHLIVDGQLAAGQRINEVHLSQQLGGSRTPLREALARLAQEGALRSVPRIGYFVRPLDIDEFEQLYDIRPILDPEALRLTGLPSPGRMQRLQGINDLIAKARDADTIIDLDDEFHLELIVDCPNKVLVDLIRQIIQRTRRYEIALMRESRNVAIAMANHKEIMTALRKRDLRGACTELRNNLRTGREPILAWLKSRETSATRQIGTNARLNRRHTMSVFVRSGRTVRFISTIVLTATLPASALADSSADELIGTWGQVLEFPPALKGELTVKRDGKTWSASIAGAQAPCIVEDQRIACAFSDGRGKYRGRLNGTGRAIEGWWLRPSGETTDRRDPGGSGQSFATLARLEQAGPETWRGDVETLPDRFSLYVHIFRNAGQIEDVESGALVAIFRNPELNQIGGSRTSTSAATATP